MRSQLTVGATRAYLLARETVEAAGFVHEIDTYTGRDLADCDARLFLRETAWVILSSGMRESVVRRAYPGVCDAFGWFESLGDIVQDPARHVSAALDAFNHRGKLEGVAFAVQWVYEKGVQVILEGVANEGPKWLCEIPFIGPVTACHLAKNLGFPVAKPDRHLVRLAPLLGFESVASLCDAVAGQTGDSPQIVDLIFWRYATLSGGSFDPLFC